MKRITFSLEEAIHLYFMCGLIKDCLLAPSKDLIDQANKFQQRILKTYPELKDHLEK